MKIGIIGATGKSGQKLTTEAIERGVDVTAIVRDVSKLTHSIKTIEKSILELTTEDIQQFDVVINTFAAPLTDADQYLVIGKHLISIFKDVSTRLIVIGGAGRLFVDEAATMQVFDTPDFPDFLVPSSKKQYASYLELKASSINWTYVSPSAFFDPEGERTGNYLVGNDHLIFNSTGESYVSYADLAVAIIDAAVNGTYIGTAITVVGEK
ncbi:NAD(P)H-binding protein [Solibacillus sp. A46]|uniref:NAD(P)H-binding protein n=1 Tax=Solibacillus faecavium TaxID=2762221 RepID=A0ABR8XVW7_9BACL|nr:NAD(P)H-binding protein [Solibacillus faecavium]MBD8036097.1 NAD(P)H-binding protein [Solibacillus faecavium]